MKIEVRKHKLSTYIDINGEIRETTWYYTLAVRKFGFWWRHLKLFFTGSTRYYRKGVVSQILKDEKVYFSYSPAEKATWFDCEDDAIRVKHDIIKNSDKYLTRKR